jgi:hypothetical protein
MPALREWERYDPPPGDLLIRVAEWGAELARDPFKDADLEHGNLFFRVVPGTEHDGMVVTLTYAVLSGVQEVQCQTFRCQKYPSLAPPEWPPRKHHSASKE